MTPDQFKRWRKRMGYNQAEAGTLLGKSKTTIWMYEAGRQEIDKTTALACAALSLGITEYPVRI